MYRKTLRIETKTSGATFYNVATKDGYKALYKYLKRLSAEKVKFTGEFINVKQL